MTTSETNPIPENEPGAASATGLILEGEITDDEPNGGQGGADYIDPEAVKREAFHATFVAAHGAVNVVRQMRGLKPYETLAQVADNADALVEVSRATYDLIDRVPWLRSILDPQSALMRDITIVGVHAFGIGSGIAAQRRQWREDYDAAQKAKAANDNDAGLTAS